VNTPGQLRAMPDAVAQYIAHCVQRFAHAGALQHKKIVLDCANGATFSCAPAIFSALGAEVIVMHAHPTGKNINDHCGATDVVSLQTRVLQEKADLGIAFDGDGDRLIAVDHTGARVDGDEILCVLALHDLQKHTAVVGTLMSNLGLEKALQSHHIYFERAEVGDRYVLDKLQKNKWRLGGEASGHIIHLDYATTGDGIITALQLLVIMQRTHHTLYDLKRHMQMRPQILLNVAVENPHRFSAMPDIAQAVLAAQAALKGEGRILLRASGTESCVRVMVECDEKQVAQSWAESLANTVRCAFAVANKSV
jgi:phosphoglucosamine mutase